MAITVAIVESSTRFRQSLEALLHGAPGFRCVGAYATTKEALRFIPACRPHVAIVGFQDCAAAQCLRQLKHRLPGVELLALATSADLDCLFAAVFAGASGYLLKTTSFTHILDAIAEIHAGGAALTSSVARRLLESLRPPPDHSAVDGELTAREREVLRLAKGGLSYRRVAQHLGISYETVRTHFNHIYAKLHVHSRAEALLKADPTLQGQARGWRAIQRAAPMKPRSRRVRCSPDASAMQGTTPEVR